MKASLDVGVLVKGYSYGTSSDSFWENYFSSVPFHGGFGLLTIHVIAKPSYLAFELPHRLGHEHLAVTGKDDTVGVWVIRDHRPGGGAARQSSSSAPSDTAELVVRRMPAAAPRSRRRRCLINMI